MARTITRRELLGTAVLAGAALAACSSEDAQDLGSPGEASTIGGSYQINIEGFTWGANTNMAIITPDTPLVASTPHDFEVFEHLQGEGGAETVSERTVTGVDVFDSATVILELACAPDTPSPIAVTSHAPYASMSNPHYLEIRSTMDPGLALEVEPTRITSSVDDWLFADADAGPGGDVDFAYALYEDPLASGTLLVWLHDLASGGTADTDPHVVLLKEYLETLIGAAFQERLGGVSVLVPQCPTFWSASTTADADPTEARSKTDGTFAYAPALEELIESTRASLKDVRVLLLGCGSGAALALALMARRPDAYTASVLLSEAREPVSLSDDELTSLARIPLYLVFAEGDATTPSSYTQGLLERLLKAGASDASLHCCVLQEVRDETVRDATGEPIRLDAHDTWVAFMTDGCTCEACGISAWDFLAGTLRDN